MADAGGSPHIGLIPRWEALYCTSADSRAYLAMVSNTRGAGRYPMHYRDETTGRVPLYASYPNATITSGWGPNVPAGSGGEVNGGWEIQHHPSVGYLCYLVAGRWAALESLQFAALYGILESNPAFRTGGVIACINAPMTTRGAAWTWRSVGQAAGISPAIGVAAADLTQQMQFATSIANTAAWAKARYIEGTVTAGFTRIR